MSRAELAEQLAEQEVFFAPLIYEPDGRHVHRGRAGRRARRVDGAGGGATDEGLVVLYHHGGGYSSGLAKWARRGTARLATALGARSSRPTTAWRRATRSRPPTRTSSPCYRHLIGVGGFDPARIAAAGDSAGGAISVTLAADARDLGMPMPACLITNSLWADIGLNTPSLDDPVRNGYDIRREMVELLSATLLSTGGIDGRDPRHSPVYRDLSGLPPLLIQAAGHDVCHDDSVRLAASARAAGVDVTITEYPDVEHIWILNGPWRIEYGEHYPDDGIRWVDSGDEPIESVTAIEEIAAFIRAHT